MQKACFAKYCRNLSLDRAIRKIETLITQGSTPIEYETVVEIECNTDCMQKIIAAGSINIDSKTASWGIRSIQNSKGVWQCIKIKNEERELLLFTEGSANILYYSFVK